MASCSPTERLAWGQKLLRLAPGDDTTFNAYALELFREQCRRNRAYQRLVRQGSPVPKSLKSWREIPAVPQTLFKSARFASHPRSATRFTFLSSGTTGAQRSQHHLTSLDIYQTVSTTAVPCLAKPRKGSSAKIKPELHFLTPSPQEASHSSLAWMFSFWQQAFGTRRSRFWVEKEELRLTALRAVLEQSINQQRPVGLLGPAFGFVHLLDAWKKAPLTLPPRSFLLETGGFKGRTREIRKPTFYRHLHSLFGIPDEEIWNEYGMCELSSQAYARGTQGEHRTPPWARVLVVDPATNREVKVGQRGLVRWIDLANVDSVLAIQTQDLARRTKDGFVLLGRLPQLPLRGCSLTVEELSAR